MVNQKYLIAQINLFKAKLILLIILLAIALESVAILLIFHELLTKVFVDEIIILIYVKICEVK